MGDWVSRSNNQMKPYLISSLFLEILIFATHTLTARHFVIFRFIISTRDLLIVNVSRTSLLAPTGRGTFFPTNGAVFLEK